MGLVQIIFCFAHYFLDIISFLAVYFEMMTSRRLFYVGLFPYLPYLLFIFSSVVAASSGGRALPLLRDVATC